ncbi:TVP38/TMEM64 family protein [Streptococcus caprae]|uniref:TVP38/TMEM64 family membrane protein n=1 Tax=Streptococcus caprae TaxID=1640501 RepID=A0ABV8CXP3_9STRE
MVVLSYNRIKHGDAGGDSLQLTQKWVIRFLTILGLLSSLAIIYYFQQHPNLFTVGGELQSRLKAFGIWAPLVFMVLQVIQVIYPIIPGGMTTVIGHVLFGPLLGFIYNVTSIFIGSVLAFYLARRYGETFMRAFVSERTYDRYIYFINKPGFAYLLGAAFALPGFPDDFLCMVAGASTMSLRKFSFIFLLTKPITLYIYTLMGYYGASWLLHLFG